MATDSTNSTPDHADATDRATSTNAAERATGTNAADGATSTTNAPTGVPGEPVETPGRAADPTDGGPAWWARYVEFTLWVAVVGGTVSAGCVALGYAVGGSLVAAKYVLFVVGFLLFGAGSFAIQPSRPGRGERRVSIEGTHQSRFEARIQELPPLRDQHLPFDRRIDRSPKVFVASLVVLAVSILLEFGLGVRM